MNDYTLLFEGIITVIVALISMFVIPWIVQRTSSEKLAKTMKWVLKAVEAAEQIYKESGMGKEKKAYVECFLNDHGINYDAEQIDALIEAAVFEMKKKLEAQYE